MAFHRYSYIFIHYEYTLNVEHKLFRDLQNCLQLYVKIIVLTWSKNITRMPNWVYPSALLLAKIHIDAIWNDLDLKSTQRFFRWIKNDIMFISELVWKTLDHVVIR